MDIKNTAEKKKLDEDAKAKKLIMDINTIVERERIIEDEQISYSKAVEDLKYEEDEGLEEIEDLEERYEIFKPLKRYDDNYKERKKQKIKISNKVRFILSNYSILNIIW